MSLNKSLPAGCCIRLRDSSILATSNLARQPIGGTLILSDWDIGHPQIRVQAEGYQQRLPGDEKLVEGCAGSRVPASRALPGCCRSPMSQICAGKSPPECAPPAAASTATAQHHVNSKYFIQYSHSSKHISIVPMTSHARTVLL